MKLFLDTDIGTDVDDALALAVIAGSPELHLAGISTVYGDTRLRAQLARRYLSCTTTAPSLPVAAGMEWPLSGKAVWWPGHEGKLFTDLHREDIIDGAVELLVSTVAAAPGEIDVLAIGPLTNIAAALNLDTEFEKNVRRLVVMGGDFREAGRIAEHNFASDILAAQEVFSSALTIVMGGLDLTLRVKLGATDVQAISASGPFGAVLAEEIRIWWKFNQTREDEQWNSPHDAILALWLAKPDLFTSAQANVSVDDEGRTVSTSDPAGSVSILSASDLPIITQEIVDRIAQASSSPDSSQS